MKKERPHPLTLARETLLNLSAEALSEIRGGSGTGISGNTGCPTNKPNSNNVTC